MRGSAGAARACPQDHISDPRLCMCNTDDRTDLSRLPDFLYQFFETALKTVAKKRPQYLVVKVVLPAGIVRSGERRDGTAIVRRRRDRVTLFRQSRREYKRDKACVSMPCEMVLPAGIEPTTAP